MSLRKLPSDGPLSAYHILHGPHDINELVQQAWARCPNLIGRDLHCIWNADHVILRGAVRTYYQKQLAQEALRAVPGITVIHNEIDVL